MITRACCNCDNYIVHSNVCAENNPTWDDFTYWYVGCELFELNKKSKKIIRKYKLKRILT